MKISAVYKIFNTITNDFYIGSSKDVKRRWNQHKRTSVWEDKQTNPLYQDFQKYGLDKFRFQILAPVRPEYLKDVEQEFIDLLHPTYNNFNAKGWDIERQKETKRKYRQTSEYKESHKEYNKTDKGKEVCRKSLKKYYGRLCSYNDEELTLATLTMRFKRAGVKHPTLEAKKYLINN